MSAGDCQLPGKPLRSCVCVSVCVHISYFSLNVLAQLVESSPSPYEV